MFNPFNYSLGQLRVALLQLLSIAILLVGFFVVLDPGTEASWQAVIAAVFGVIAVFGKNNPDPQQAEKSIMSLVASIVGVITLYGGGVADETIERIGLLVGALIPPALVFFNQNDRSGV